MTHAPASTQQATPLTVAVPEDPYVRAAFSRRPSADETTGAGNVSLSVGNEPGRPGSALGARARLADAVGLGAADVVYAEQVHGTGVAVVGRDDRGRGTDELSSAVPRVDALVATEPGVGVAALAADCMPLLLVLPGRAVAAVHAGRRGVEAGIVPTAVSTLVDDRNNSVISDVIAIMGPAIGGCCYEVPPDLADSVASRLPATAATTRWGTPGLDIRAGVRAQLEEAGVARVAEVGECTFCGGGPWFSARSSGSTLRGGGPVGRHAGIVCRHDPATGGPLPSS